MIILILCLLVSLGSAYSSSVSVFIPLDQQLPDIARVDKEYSWSFSANSFGSSNGVLNYSASSLPDWLSFNPSTLTLSGTPSAKDEGNPDITVTAHDSISSASSEFTLCVTSYPPPTLHLPLAAQFHASNPSLSSVFLLAPNSAVATVNPALRIPPRWSFSIGFQGNTFTTANNLYYAALQADGSALPDWMVFNADTITLNGVVPDEHTMQSPQTMSLALHASDHEGYTASSLPFDLVLALHELSLLAASLPTINVTASTSFNISLSSPADFSGVLVDANPIQPSDIASLSIDTSQYEDCLKYDDASRTLSGDTNNCPGQQLLLPVTLVTTFNQSIRTNVSLAVVPSYFSASNLPQVQVTENEQLNFNLVQYFSNATSGEQHSDVNLTAIFDPAETGDYLEFDAGSGQLRGNIPANFSSSNTNQIVVTFTAYSRVTHSTSHARLLIVVSPSVYEKKGFGAHPSNLSVAAHTKLVLGLGIAFGVTGGLFLIGGLLAAFRRCARVDDTALRGEEGMGAWTEKDKKWYGISTESGKSSAEDHRGYGWTEQTPDVSEKSRHAMDIQNPFDLGYTAPARNGPDYGDLGLGLRRVSERSRSSPSPKSDIPGKKVQSPGVMSKREFLTRIKETVRQMSDKYTRNRPAATPKHPVIGKPILISPSRIDGLPFGEGSVLGSSNPFDDTPIASYPGSAMISFTNSPSSSTGEHSIPRRRADFAPPRSPALVHFEDERPLSTNSTGSLASDASARTHAAEAIVQTATRATSVRSGRSSHQSLLPESPLAAGTRPRLVPFTSATRVPVPRVPSMSLAERSDGSLATAKRVASQSARVWKNGSQGVQPVVKKSRSGDELSMGLHYVRTLGADQQILIPNPPPPTKSMNVRSSFSSLASSRQGRASGGMDVARMSVRTGENSLVPSSYSA